VTTDPQRILGTRKNTGEETTRQWRRCKSFVSR